MMIDEYSAGLGRMLANLQSLEFALRAYLSYWDDPAIRLQPERRLQELSVGEVVHENSITNYETLGRLVDRYNSRLPVTDRDCKVCSGVVTIRDALAHGRATSLTGNLEDVVLLKFSPPSDGKVKVVFAEKLTRDWLEGWIIQLASEIKKVLNAMERERRRRMLP